MNLPTIIVVSLTFRLRGFSYHTGNYELSDSLPLAPKTSQCANNVDFPVQNTAISTKLHIGC